MKILLCTGIYPPEAGGPATYTKLLAEELVKRGHKVAMITYSQPINGQATGSPPIYRLIRITRSHFKFWHYYKYFRAVKTLGRGFDVLYAQDPVSAGYPTMLAAKVLKKPFVVKVTGDYSWEQAMGRRLTAALIDEFQDMLHYPFWIKLMRRIQIRVCREANLIITPSEYLKRLVLGWGVKEKIIRVIYNAAPPVPKIEKTPHDDFRVLSVGRDVRWKGFSVLREVIEDIKKEIPNINLNILQKESREEVLRNLAGADVFVLNSAYEGTSHVVLEAMALGTPVVTTRVGGNPEIVTPSLSPPFQGGDEEGVGILVEFNNKEQIKAAIRKLYNEPEFGFRLAEAAKETVETKFNKETMVAQTAKELQLCVS